MPTHGRYARGARKKLITFNQRADAWFSKLANAGICESALGAKITKITLKTGSKANLQTLIAALRAKGPWVAPLRLHAQRILAGDFRSEYRYNYGGRTVHGITGRVSATAAFFDLVHQAVNYAVALGWSR